MAHSIYADELTSLKHGYPLWEPDCDPEVSIADVGYVRNGQFCRLFNASLPKGDPANQKFGEPDGYEPLHIGAIQDRTPHPPGVMVSRSVSKQGADIGFSGSILEAGAGFHFACKKNRGAILIINSEAYRQDALRSGAFKDYLIKHYKSWIKLANNQFNARDISLNDLIFVTGRDNTADWAMATFSQRSLSGGISFEAGYPVIAGAQFSIWGSWKQTNNMHTHCGPRIRRTDRAITETESTEDDSKPLCAAELNRYTQCIFLRGFRILDRKTHTRRKFSIKVKDNSGGLEEVLEPWFQRSLSSSEFSDSSSHNKGRSNSDGGSLRSDSYLSKSISLDCDSMEIVLEPNFSQDRAPIDALLEYILEKSDEATIAVAHDDDLIDILQGEDEDVDIENSIRSSSPRIYVDSQGVGMIKEYETHSTHSPPVAVKSEMLQNEAFLHLSPKGSGRSTPSVAPTETPNSQELHLFLKKQHLMQASIDEQRHESQRDVQVSPSSTHTRKAVKNPSEAYHAEQDAIRSEIDILQARLAKVQERISLATKTGRGADRRNALRAELDMLRDQRLSQKTAQDAISAELRSVQEETRLKIKNLQGIVKKLPARTTTELDAQIRTLERRVDTGTMGLNQEKAALRQISSLRRSRTAVENSQGLQANIDELRLHADSLRKRLDSGLVVTNARINSVHEELEALRRESDAAFAERGTLHEERAQLQTRLSALREQRRQATERFRSEREEHRRLADEERARLAAQARVEKATREEQRRIQAQEKLMEKARAPAFLAEIKDCRSLIEHFSGMDKGNRSTSTMPSPVSPISEATHQPSHPVENHPEAWEGWVPLKKKAQEDSYFVGGKGKAKKGHRKAASAAAAGSVHVRLPLGIVSTLLSLSISPPVIVDDVPQTIEALRKKVEWYEANQERVTEENVMKAEADLQRIAKPMSNILMSVAT